jgi:hypothetical protein
MDADRLDEDQDEASALCGKSGRDKGRFSLSSMEWGGSPMIAICQHQIANRRFPSAKFRVSKNLKRVIAEICSINIQ